MWIIWSSCSKFTCSSYSSLHRNDLLVLLRCNKRKDSQKYISSSHSVGEDSISTIKLQALPSLLYFTEGIRLEYTLYTSRMQYCSDFFGYIWENIRGGAHKVKPPSWIPPTKILQTLDDYFWYWWNFTEKRNTKRRWRQMKFWIWGAFFISVRHIFKDLVISWIVFFSLFLLSKQKRSFICLSSAENIWNLHLCFHLSWCWGLTWFPDKFKGQSSIINWTRYSHP